jgi:hypothetical protein
MSTTTIADNALYSIVYSGDKNRFYLTLRGFWRSPESTPNYLKDWEHAIKLAQPGFTILADVREAKTFPQDVIPLHEEAQRKLIQAGLKQTAEVVAENIFMEIQTAMFSKKTQMPSNKCKSIEEAESFLDSLS